MMQIETGGNLSFEGINDLRCSSSFNSPGGSERKGSTKKYSPPPFPMEEASLSAIVKVSKMQVSFAERTATEMEEIVSWYKKYEGVERFKKQNQQSQSMPDNAMIVVDDDDDEGFDAEENDGGKNNNTCEIQCTNQEEDPRHELQVGDEDYVMVKDYYTPNQKSKTMKSVTSSTELATSLLSAIRSISKGRKHDDPPPTAIKILVEDEDESVFSPLTTRYNPDDVQKRAKQPNVDSLSQDLIRDSPKSEEITPFRDKEEEVTAMLSPSGCTELTAQTLFENMDTYCDTEQEVLELLSPVTFRSKSSFGSSSPSETSTEGLSNDSMEYVSTCHETQSQIKATADLIRNTQNMAEIISQLQLSSSASSMSDSDDDDDIVGIYDSNVNSDDNGSNIGGTFGSTKIESSPTSSTRRANFEKEISFDMQSVDAACSMDSQSRFRKRKSIGEHFRMEDQSGKSLSYASFASVKGTKIATNKISRLSRLQRQQLYRFLVPSFLSLVIGIVLNFVL